MHSLWLVAHLQSGGAMNSASRTCRCYGFLLSRKRFIYTIDDDCFVAKDPTGVLAP